jgi:glucokinase
VSEQLLVGLDFGGTKLAVVVADRDGTRMADRVLPTDAEQGAEQAVHRAIAAARELVAERSAEAAAVGVATMGITREDHVELAPNVPGWERLALPRLLREEFGTTPVVIANDVKAAAVAELTWGELRNVSTGIYVNLGTGFATALIVGGAVLDGAHGAAGEIGYWARSRADEFGNRDGRGPVEDYVSGVGVADRARSELGVEGGVAALTASDDPAAAAFLTDLYDEIALHVANLTIALDPEVVVLGGGFARDSEQLCAAVADRVDAQVPYPPELRVARFGGDAAIAGAIALALQAGEP